VIAKERKGIFLGGTIQVVPHITAEIKDSIHRVPQETDAEVVIVEVGGTVGDIESLPFLEALRQMRYELGREDTLYVHVTWLPHIGATGELKTKPTQHSVRELRSIGIQADLIIARSDHPMGDDLMAKIALFCDVGKEGVIPLVSTSVLYEVPLLLERYAVADYILHKLNLKARRKPDWKQWKELVAAWRAPRPKLRIAVVGKYVELEDAYMSVREAVCHATLALGVDADIDWVHSADLENDIGWEDLRKADGVIIPGGFGDRGIEGKIAAAGYARTEGVPYLGLCLGMQVMVIEFARNQLGNKDANSTEFDPKTPHPVIDLMPDQRDLDELGGTMRLGLYPCKLTPKTRSAQAYGTDLVEERHRHRFEFNNSYRQAFEDHGMRMAGISPDDKLVEIAELADHDFMLGSQFHPEFRSRPNRPHPLFTAFIKATIQRARMMGKDIASA
jgi:CTP synthase